MSEAISGIFVVPFLTGLLLAISLPMLGCYLRLRHEWLAALAYANVAAAGALAALIFGIPLSAGGAAAALAAAFGKRLAGPRLGKATGYAVLLLFGWAVAVLAAANLPLAERLGHALFDGQLYFSGMAHLAAAAAVATLALPLLAGMTRNLLLAELYPHHFRLQGKASWPLQFGFDFLVVVTLVAATLSIGVMGSFVLAFVPPWLAFAHARSWWRGVALAVGTGVLAHVLAFWLALRLDQPFGPVLVLVMLVLALPASGFSDRHRINP